MRIKSNKRIKDTSSTELKKLCQQYGIDSTGMSVAQMEDALGKKIWEQEHPGEEMPEQIAPMLINDITSQGKDYVNSHFKKETHWLQNKINGERFILQINPDGSTHMTSRSRSVKTFRYSELDGRVLGLLDLKSPFAGKTVFDGECLTGDVRVLTNRGYLQLEELFRIKLPSDRVWTGTCWSEFNVISRGLKPVKVVKFSNGQHLIMSLDHLMKTREGWFSTPVAKNCPYFISVVSEFEFGDELMTESQAYWLGRVVGDGGVAIYTDGNQVHHRVYCSFGYHEDACAQKFVEFLQQFGANIYIIRAKTAINVLCEDKIVFEWFVSTGYTVGSNARNKTIPDLVWRCSLHLRQKFLEGYGDADGNKSKVSGLKINIETASKTLAGEVVLLWAVSGRRFQTCARENYRGSGRAYDGYYNIYKAYEVSNLTRAGRVRSSVSVTSLRELSNKEELYTLQVLDESHAFVANGFIHHNCIMPNPRIKLPSGVETTSTLQSTVALLHLNKEQSLELQAEYGSLVYKVFDILKLDGKSTEELPYEERADLTVTAVQAMQDANPGISMEALPVIKDYDAAWALFEEYVGKGGEGLIIKERKAPYERGKRVKTQLKLKGFQTVDGFVTGFVSSSKDKGLSNYIGGLKFSSYVDGELREIAAVSNIDLETRKAATSYDENGNPTLNPEWLNRCAEILGQDWNQKSLRLNSARINEWRDDKNPEDCSVRTEEMKFNTSI